MAQWSPADDLRALAEKVISARQDVAHVEVDAVVFLWEEETSPKALARCYRLADHPIGAFCPAEFAVVFYRAKTEGLSDRQLALLMWHELKHIPERGDKLVDHDLKDFLAIVGHAGATWAEPGAEIPDILTDGATERNI